MGIGSAYEHFKANDAMKDSVTDTTGDSSKSTATISPKREPSPARSPDASPKLQKVRDNTAATDLAEWKEVESEGAYNLSDRADIMSALRYAIPEDIKNAIIAPTRNSTKLAIVLYGVYQNNLLLSVNEVGKYILSTTHYYETNQSEVSFDIEMFNTAAEVVEFLRQLKTVLDENQPSAGPNYEVEVSTASKKITNFIENYTTTPKDMK